MFYAGQIVTAQQMRAELGTTTYFAGQKVRTSQLDPDLTSGERLRAEEMNLIFGEPVDPGPGPGGTPRNPGEALWIGHGLGSNHFDVGIGVDGEGLDGYQPGDTVNTSETAIGNGFSQNPNFMLTPSGDVQFRVSAGAGRTSTNTHHPRSELREYDENGQKSAWDGSDGYHVMRGRSRITKVTNKRPWVCIFQIHDASSDLIRIQSEGTTGQTTGLSLRARFTPPGGSDQSQTLSGWSGNYSVGTWLDWEISIGGTTSADDGRLRVRINNVVVFDRANMGTTGCYFKAGNYLQSSTETQGEDPNDFSAVEIAKGTFQHWHTGWTANTTPVYTG